MSSTDNGSIDPTEYLNCLEDPTNKRTNALQACLHREEGDLSRPVR